jgi:hypothetical protein
VLEVTLYDALITELPFNLMPSALHFQNTQLSIVTAA